LPGKTLYIPAYWWYSIRFGPNTSISTMFYRTYMNNLAISPYIGMHALQIQNVKREVVKKVSISELNPLLKKVEQNANVKEDSAPVVPTPPQVPEPFLANSVESVSVLSTTDL